jgi:hypothetical protein
VECIANGSELPFAPLVIGNSMSMGVDSLARLDTSKVLMISISISISIGYSVIEDGERSICKQFLQGQRRMATFIVSM